MLLGGQGYRRYPNWTAMDMSAFTQDKTPVDRLPAHYESASGITVTNRPWYRAFNAFKMAVVCLIGAMLVEDGHSDDQKLVLAAYGTSLLTGAGLTELGIDESLDDGPVLPREQRIQQVLAQSG